MIRLAGLEVDSGVRHAFFTRQGGVSNGFYTSLNCGYGSGDEAAKVERNRAIAMEMIGVPESFGWMTPKPPDASRQIITPSTADR